MGRTGQGSMKRRKSFFKAGHGVRSAGWTCTGEALDTPRQRLTHQEFDRTFTSSDDVIVPIAARVLNSQCNQLDSTHLPASPGAALRPLVNESSKVEILLKERKEDNEIGGYLDVHLPTCVNAIQECISEHQEESLSCPGRLITAANLTTKWGFSARMRLTCQKCRLCLKKYTESCWLSTRHANTCGSRQAIQHRIEECETENAICPGNTDARCRGGKHHA